jgi:hypothetical protein
MMHSGGADVEVEGFEMAFNLWRPRAWRDKTSTSKRCRARKKAASRMKGLASTLVTSPKE